MSWSGSKSFSASAQADGPASRSIAKIVTDHYGFVWRTLRASGVSAADADDAAQQVFMTLARKLDSVTPGSERSFIYGATLRVASNIRRGVRRRREVSVDSAPERLEPASHGPERSRELVEARALLADILAKLPEVSRRVLVLAEIEQLEVPEIAALERVPVGTAASRLRRAREQFRELLEAARARNPFGAQP